MVPWVGMQCVIVVFPDHTNLLFVLIIGNIPRMTLFEDQPMAPIGRDARTHTNSDINIFEATIQ